MTIPPTVTTSVAAPLVGRSRVTLTKHSHSGIGVGESTITPLRIGNVLAWPTAPLFAALGITNEAEQATVLEQIENDLKSIREEDRRRVSERTAA